MLDPRSAWLTPRGARAPRRARRRRRARCAPARGEVRAARRGRAPRPRGGRRGGGDRHRRGAGALRARGQALAHRPAPAPGADARALSRRDRRDRCRPASSPREPASISGRAASITRAYRVNLERARPDGAAHRAVPRVLDARPAGGAAARGVRAAARARRHAPRRSPRCWHSRARSIGALGALHRHRAGPGGEPRAPRASSAPISARATFAASRPAFAPDPLALAGIALARHRQRRGRRVGGRARRRPHRRRRRHCAIAPSTCPTRRRDGAVPRAGARRAAARCCSSCRRSPGLPLGGYLAIARVAGAPRCSPSGPLCRALLARLAPRRDPVAALAAAQVRHLPGHLAASVAGHRGERLALRRDGGHGAFVPRVARPLALGRGRRGPLRARLRRGRHGDLLARAATARRARCPASRAWTRCATTAW